MKDFFIHKFAIIKNSENVFEKNYLSNEVFYFQKQKSYDDKIFTLLLMLRILLFL